MDLNTQIVYALSQEALGIVDSKKRKIETAYHTSVRSLHEIFGEKPFSFEDYRRHVGMLPQVRFPLVYCHVIQGERNFQTSDEAFEILLDLGFLEEAR